MASCIRNIFPKNYQNLIIRFQVTVKNVRMLSWDTVYCSGPMEWLSYLTWVLFACTQLAG